MSGGGGRFAGGCGRFGWPCGAGIAFDSAITAESVIMNLIFNRSDVTQVSLVYDVVIRMTIERKRAMLLSFSWASEITFRSEIRNCLRMQISNMAISSDKGCAVISEVKDIKI